MNAIVIGIKMVSYILRSRTLVFDVAGLTIASIVTEDFNTNLKMSDRSSDEESYARRVKE